MCGWRVTRWRRRLAAATWSVLDVGRAEPLDDQVLVVLTGEGLVMKRLRRRDDPWELKSDNPAHESRAVTGQDRILGQSARGYLNDFMGDLSRPNPQPARQSRAPVQ